MADTEKLKSMLDNIVNDNPAAAEVNFHEYAREKMLELLGRKPTEATERADNED